MALPWGSRTPGLRVMNTRAFMVSPVALDGAAPMASLSKRGKLYPLFSVIRAFSRGGDPIAACGGGSHGRVNFDRHVHRAGRLGLALLRLERSGRQGPARP